MSEIQRHLPNNQYLAAMNADNPSASNPFLTKDASGVVGIIAGSTGDSNTVSNSNAETAIITNNFDFPIPANVLIVGDRIRITAFARWGTGNAIRNLQFRLKVNGITLIGTKAIQLPVNQTNRGAWIDATITIRSIGAPGTAICGMNITMGDASSTSPILGDTTPSAGLKAVDTTLPNIFNFSVQWSGGAPSATNTITFEEILFEKLRV